MQAHNLRSWLLVCVLAACGCGSKDSGGGATGTPSGSAGPGTGSSPPAAPADSVELFVDERSVGRITKEQIAAWPRLDSLVPEHAKRVGQWETIYLRGKVEKPAEINRPSQTHPEWIAAVYPGANGKPAFGMFDPVELANKGQPGLRQDDLREIRIARSKGERSGDHQGGGAGGGSDPLKMVLKIETPGGDKSMPGDKILAVPREAMPGSADTKGWPLTKLLAAAGVTKFTKLVLIDAAGTSLSIERKDFDDKTTIPFIKLNRQGSLRFRLLKKQGEGWQYAGDLRALSTIKVD